MSVESETEFSSITSITMTTMTQRWPSSATVDFDVRRGGGTVTIVSHNGGIENVFNVSRCSRLFK